MFAFYNAASTAPVADFDWFRIDGPARAFAARAATTTSPATSLDKTRWNAIVRENPRPSTPWAAAT